jgi:hypothetical protein
MMYETVIPIHVELGGNGEAATSLGEVIDRITDQLALIDEQTPDFLDYAVSSDAGDNSVIFEVTANAPDELEAVAGSLSWVRTAFHAAGAETPGWSVAGLGAVRVEPATVPG